MGRVPEEKAAIVDVNIVVRGMRRHAMTLSQRLTNGDIECCLHIGNRLVIMTNKEEEES